MLAVMPWCLIKTEKIMSCRNILDHYCRKRRHRIVWRCRTFHRCEGVDERISYRRVTWGEWILLSRRWRLYIESKVNSLEQSCCIMLVGEVFYGSVSLISTLIYITGWQSGTAFKSKFVLKLMEIILTVNRMTYHRHLR